MNAGEVKEESKEMFKKMVMDEKYIFKSVKVGYSFFYESKRYW